MKKSISISATFLFALLVCVSVQSNEAHAYAVYGAYQYTSDEAWRVWSIPPSYSPDTYARKPTCSLTAQSGRILLTNLYNNPPNTGRLVFEDWDSGSYYDTRRTLSRSVSVPAGTYTVKLQVWDGYDNRHNVYQPNEKMKLVLADGSGIIVESSASEDLPDNVTEVAVISETDSALVVSRPATIMYVRHAEPHPYYVPADGSAGSLVPVCAALDLVPSDPPPTVNLTAASTNLDYNTSTTLTWVTTDATSCTASNGWSGSKSASGGSESTGNLTAGKTYSIQCTGPGGTSGASVVTVSVGSEPAPTVTLVASDETPSYNTAVNLTWIVSGNASSCTASGNWSGSKSTGGGTESTGSLTSSKTYSVQCTGPGGDSNIASVTVNPNPAPPTVSLAADDTSPTYNTGTTLRWVVSNASSCVASDGWSGSKSTSGGSEATGNLTSTETYRLTCSGTGGSDYDEVTVSPQNPPAPTVGISACALGGAGCVNSGTKELSSGTEGEIQWTVSGTVDWCGVTTGGSYGFGVTGISGGTDDSISEPTYGNTYEFGVQCKYGPSYSADKRVSLTMGASKPTITANGAGDGETIRIRGNEDVTIEWNTTDSTPDTCAITGGSLSGYNPQIDSNPSGSHTGSETVTVLGTTTYTIDCGANGSATVTVELIPSVFES